MPAFFFLLNLYHHKTINMRLKLHCAIAAISLFCISQNLSFAQTIPVIDWDITVGGSSGDTLSAIHETSDGGFIRGGYSCSGNSGDKTQPNKGSSDFWIVKLSGVGIKQWDVDLGGSGYEVLSAICQTSD